MSIGIPATKRYSKLLKYFLTHRKSTEARTSLPNNQQELNEAEKELAEVKQKDHGLRQEINSLMAKTQEKRNQVQDRRSRGRVLDFIMKKKAEGIVPGVFGRLVSQNLALNSKKFKL